MRRRGLVRVLSVVLLGAATAAPRALLAQAAMSITATATVDNTALTAVTAQPLAFSTVIPGTPVTINPVTQTTSAGMIRIQGAKKATVLISFTLPTVLRAGTGPYTMPISFGATSACALPIWPSPSTCTPVNPATTYTGQIPNKAYPQNEIDVYIGGTASPAAGQHGGVYTGTIVLTVIY